VPAMFKCILIACFVATAAGAAAVEFQDSAGECTMEKAGSAIESDCELKVKGVDVASEITTMKGQIQDLFTKHTNLNDAITTVQENVHDLSGTDSTNKFYTKLATKIDNCNNCFSWDFAIGNEAQGSYNHGWGSTFVEVEAWGGHQGGGVMGCYFHGKYSLNAYQDLKVVGPDHNGASDSASVTEHNWGYSSASGCGQFIVERPGQDQSLDEDADGCGASTAAPDGTTRNCDAGVRSQHGWHSNIIRVKKTAGGDVHGGPFFVKVTVFNHGRGIYNVKVSDSKAC